MSMSHRSASSRSCRLVRRTRPRSSSFLAFNDARVYMHKQGLRGWADWEQWCSRGRRPSYIPSSPCKAYRGQYQGLPDFLGYRRIPRWRRHGEDAEQLRREELISQDTRQNHAFTVFAAGYEWFTTRMKAEVPGLEFSPVPFQCTASLLYRYNTNEDRWLPLRLVNTSVLPQPQAQALFHLPQEPCPGPGVAMACLPAERLTFRPGAARKADCKTIGIPYRDLLPISGVTHVLPRAWQATQEQFADSAFKWIARLTLKGSREQRRYQLIDLLNDIIYQPCGLALAPPTDILRFGCDSLLSGRRVIHRCIVKSHVDPRSGRTYFQIGLGKAVAGSAVIPLQAAEAPDLIVAYRPGPLRGLWILPRHVFAASLVQKDDPGSGSTTVPLYSPGCRPILQKARQKQQLQLQYYISLSSSTGNEDTEDSSDSTAADASRAVVLELSDVERVRRIVLSTGGGSTDQEQSCGGSTDQSMLVSPASPGELPRHRQRHLQYCAGINTASEAATNSPRPQPQQDDAPRAPSSAVPRTEWSSSSSVVLAEGGNITAALPSAVAAEAARDEPQSRDAHIEGFDHKNADLPLRLVSPIPIMKRRVGRTQNEKGRVRKRFLPFARAREIVRTLGLRGSQDWIKWSSSTLRPEEIPSTPHRTYRREWRGMRDWLGSTPPVRHWQQMLATCDPPPKSEVVDLRERGILWLIEKMARLCPEFEFARAPYNTQAALYFRRKTASSVLISSSSASRSRSFSSGGDCRSQWLPIRVSVSRRSGKVQKDGTNCFFFHRGYYVSKVPCVSVFLAIDHEQVLVETTDYVEVAGGMGRKTGKTNAIAEPMVTAPLRGGRALTPQPTEVVEDVDEGIHYCRRGADLFFQHGRRSAKTFYVSGSNMMSVDALTGQTQRSLESVRQYVRQAVWRA